MTSQSSLNTPITLQSKSIYTQHSCQTNSRQKEKKRPRRKKQTGPNFGETAEKSAKTFRFFPILSAFLQARASLSTPKCAPEGRTVPKMTLDHTVNIQRFYSDSKSEVEK
jgi:hypothetical protein